MSTENTLPVVRHAPQQYPDILDMLQSGKDLEDVANTPGMPCRRTLYNLLWESDEIAQALARARQIKALRVVEEAQSIADEPLNADPKLASAGVQRNAQRVGFRQWLAARYDRALFGDRTEVALSGSISALVAFVGSTPRAEDRGRVIDAIPHAVVPDGATEDPAT